MQVDIVADGAGLATAANQLANGHDVTVDNGAAGAAVNIQDGGNKITVDWNGTDPPIGAGTEAAALRVTMATDSTGTMTVDGTVTANPASGTIDTVTTVSTVTNVAQFGGQAVSMGTGVRDAGTQRVTIATNDSVPVTGTVTVTATNLDVQSGGADLVTRNRPMQSQPHCRPGWRCRWHRHSRGYHAACHDCDRR
jgi:hypothetical protein